MADRIVHIRDDGKTQMNIQPPMWQALCGVDRPVASCSERHARLVMDGVIPTGQEDLCPACVAALQAKP